MSRNIVPGVNEEKNDADSLMDSDSDDEPPPLFGNRGMSNLVKESWRAVEIAALSIPNDVKTHSISSRLGGTLVVDSVRSSVRGSVLASFRDPGLMNEKTFLVPKLSDALEGDDEDEDDDEGDMHLELPQPPLMKWIWIALACAGCYALYNISIKKGSSSINPIMGGVILQFVAALLGTLLLSAMIMDGKASEIFYDNKGITWSVGAGLWVGTAEMVSFVVSGMGVPATQFIPIIIGGSVCFGSILGVVTLGETVMLHGWSGIIMLCAGIVMVATDPG